jgi:mRNA-degrading endonuclease RelE of RelBE toxin-antitoxin system
VASFELDFDSRAGEDLEDHSPEVAERILERLQELQENPQPRGDTIKHLRGFSTPTFRFRVGDYRAVFRIAGHRVVVLRVIHRSELDRALDDLR